MPLLIADYSSSLVTATSQDRLTVASVAGFPAPIPPNTARVSVEHPETHEIVRRLVTGVAGNTLVLDSPLGVLMPAGSLVELRNDARTLTQFVGENAARLTDQDDAVIEAAVERQVTAGLAARLAGYASAAALSGRATWGALADTWDAIRTELFAADTTITATRIGTDPLPNHHDIHGAPALVSGMVFELRVSDSGGNYLGIAVQHDALLGEQEVDDARAGDYTAANAVAVPLVRGGAWDGRKYAYLFRTSTGLQFGASVGGTYTVQLVPLTPRQTGSAAPSGGQDGGQASPATVHTDGSTITGTGAANDPIELARAVLESISEKLSAVVSDGKTVVGDGTSADNIRLSALVTGEIDALKKASERPTGGFVIATTGTDRTGDDRGWRDAWNLSPHSNASDKQYYGTLAAGSAPNPVIAVAGGAWRFLSVTSDEAYTSIWIGAENPPDTVPELPPGLDFRITLSNGDIHDFRVRESESQGEESVQAPEWPSDGGQYTEGRREYEWITRPALNLTGATVQALLPPDASQAVPVAPPGTVDLALAEQGEGRKSVWKSVLDLIANGSFGVEKIKAGTEALKRAWRDAIGAAHLGESTTSDNAVDWSHDSGFLAYERPDSHESELAYDTSAREFQGDLRVNSTQTATLIYSVSTRRWSVTWPVGTQGSTLADIFPDGATGQMRIEVGSADPVDYALERDGSVGNAFSARTAALAADPEGIPAGRAAGETFSCTVNFLYASGDLVWPEGLEERTATPRAAANEIKRFLPNSAYDSDNHVLTVRNNDGTVLTVPTQARGAPTGRTTAQVRADILAALTQFPQVTGTVWNALQFALRAGDIPASSVGGGNLDVSTPAKLRGLITALGLQYLPPGALADKGRIAASRLDANLADLSTLHPLTGVLGQEVVLFGTALPGRLDRTQRWAAGTGAEYTLSAPTPNGPATVTYDTVDHTLELAYPDTAVTQHIVWIGTSSFTVSRQRGAALGRYSAVVPVDKRSLFPVDIFDTTWNVQNSDGWLFDASGIKVLGSADRDAFQAWLAIRDVAEHALVANPERNKIRLQAEYFSANTPQDQAINWGDHRPSAGRRIAVLPGDIEVQYYEASWPFAGRRYTYLVRLPTGDTRSEDRLRISIPGSGAAPVELAFGAAEVRGPFTYFPVSVAGRDQAGFRPGNSSLAYNFRNHGSGEYRWQTNADSERVYLDYDRSAKLYGVTPTLVWSLKDSGQLPVFQDDSNNWMSQQNAARMLHLDSLPSGLLAMVEVHCENRPGIQSRWFDLDQLKGVNLTLSRGLRALSASPAKPLDDIRSADFVPDTGGGHNCLRMNIQGRLFVWLARLNGILTPATDHGETARWPNASGDIRVYVRGGYA